MIRDAAGNLYGTAIEGGDLTCYSYGCGTVFELDAIGEFKVLHSFTGPDGVGPLAGLVGDLARNLYGIAQVGGASNLGTVFKLTLNTTGKYEVLHSFNGADGSYPQRNGPLVRDAAGNLYGTATVGGDFGYGTVFKLTP